MPRKSIESTERVQEQLGLLGAALRVRRKQLGLSAVVVAEAAGISRVTLHRIEKGEPSVAVGAYGSTANALGVQLTLTVPEREEAEPPSSVPEGVVPVSIRLNDYPELRRLAWQLPPNANLKAREALDIYERNRRHLDEASLSARESNLISNLKQLFDTAQDDV